MDQIKVDFSDWQGLVYLDPSRYKVINCGRRAGKSFLSAWKMLEFATNHDNSICWYISPTYKQSKLIMWAMLSDIIPVNLIAKKNETELRIDLINGSQIHLKGADNPDSLRGVRIDFCIVDETAFIDKWDSVWKVIRPTLIDSKADVWFISTPNGFNHFRDLYNTQKEGWRSFHFTSYDNPFLDKAEIDDARTSMDADSFSQEFMGEFRKLSGLIYKEFNCDVHMVDVPPNLDNYTITRALDFGFAHKTALIYFAISPHGDAIYAFDGLYESGMVLSEIADVIKVKDAGHVITNSVADSAQPASIEELKHYDIYFKPVDKEKDSVKNGITRVAEMLKVRNDTGRPTLMFNKNLTWIADEFERYRWLGTDNPDDDIKEVPMKVNDDAMDAIRYFVMSYRKEDEIPAYIPQNDFSAWSS